jgi:Bacterial protein of unknown function (DUF899)
MRFGFERRRTRKKATQWRAARRRLPMVEVDSATPLIGPYGPVILLETFDGRRQLIAYYFMWNTGGSAAEQCEGCTLYTTQVRELSFLQFPRRDVRHILPGLLRQEHHRLRGVHVRGGDYSAPETVAPALARVRRLLLVSSPPGSYERSIPMTGRSNSLRRLCQRAT